MNIFFVFLTVFSSMYVYGSTSERVEAPVDLLTYPQIPAWSILHSPNIERDIKCLQDWRDDYAVRPGEWIKEALQICSQQDMKRRLGEIARNEYVYSPCENMPKFAEILLAKKDLFEPITDQTRGVFVSVWKIVFDAWVINEIIKGLPETKEVCFPTKDLKPVLEKKQGLVIRGGLCIDQQNDVMCAAISNMPNVLTKKDRMVGKEAHLFISQHLYLFATENADENLVNAVQCHPVWNKVAIIQSIRAPSLDAMDGFLKYRLWDELKESIRVLHEINGHVYTVMLPSGFQFGGLAAQYCRRPADSSAMAPVMLGMTERRSAQDLYVKIKENPGSFEYNDDLPEENDVIVGRLATYAVLKTDAEKGEVLVSAFGFSGKNSWKLGDTYGGAPVWLNWQKAHASQKFYKKESWSLEKTPLVNGEGYIYDAESCRYLPVYNPFTSYKRL